MKILSFKIIFPVIFSLLVISLSIFFFLEIETENKIKNSLLELQKEKQREITQRIAENLAQVFKNARGQLQVFTLSENLQNGDFTSNETRKVLESLFKDIDFIADRILILDSNDVVVMDIHDKEHSTVLTKDFSYQDFVKETRINNTSVFSTGYTALDGTYKIAINYPIINHETGEYLGMIGTRIGTKDIFSKFGNVENPKIEFIIAYDTNANFLVTPLKNETGHSFIGKNIFSKEFQNVLSNESGRTAIKNVFQTVLETGKPTESSLDIGGLDGEERFGTEYPIIIDGKPVYFIHYVTPLSSIYTDINELFFSAKLELIVIIAITVSIAILLFLLAYNWTRALNKEVKQKTQELEENNQKLNDNTKKLKLSVDALVIAKENLEQNNKMQKEFINVAAHELRTPTQSIVGYLEMVRSFPENFKKYLEPLERNSERLYRLTEDILDIARIESNNLKLNKERFDIANLVIDTIDDFTNKFQNTRKNSFKIVYIDDNKDSKKDIVDNKKVRQKEEEDNDEDKKKIFVHADKNRIQQVITNLLLNAYKFTENGQIVVQIKKLNNDKKVKISIQDNGQGIDEGILPKLFEKFATKSDTGTGLGLYISKKIVEAHGGTIRGYNNEDGKGATFEFIPSLEKP